MSTGIPDRLSAGERKVDNLLIKSFPSRQEMGAVSGAEIADEFFEFIKGAELVIHNAAFDVGFINHEFSLLQPSLPPVEQYCTILDTLMLLPLLKARNLPSVFFSSSINSSMFLVSK